MHSFTHARRALALLAAAIGGLASLPASAATERPAFRSLAYDVQLTPDFAEGVLRGEELLRFQSLTDGLDTLSFTANPLAINATLDGQAGVTTTVDGRRLLVHLPRRLRKGETATLRLAFAGRADKEVPFTAELIHTAFLTCRAMVCDDDRPGDRAPLAFALTLPADMDAVAPGRLVARSPARAGPVTWRWRAARPYPAYLYGFAAGRFQRTTLPGHPELSVLSTGETLEHIQAMFGDTARMAAFFADKAGLPLPEGAYAQVLVDHRGDQEDVGLSMIQRGSITPILADPHEDWIVAHELAHQWWGNLLTCADWHELWLNEGLANFMVAAWKEQRWGRAAYDREVADGQSDWDKAKAGGLDRPLSWSGDYPSLADKRRIAYGKSVVFLDRLRSELGDAAFWAGLRAYTQANAGRSVTAHDLQRAMEKAAGRDLGPLFRTWVYGEAD
jgi:aminopeptidase N